MMSDEKQQEATYKRIKKRLDDHRYRSGFFTIGAMLFAVLLVLSLFPLVPIVVVAIMGLAVEGPVIVIVWLLCIFLFGILFWIFQKLAQKTEEKRGITLEEKMYVKAYESLCFFKESFDLEHPIASSRSKAVGRLREIDFLLGMTTFPNVTIVWDVANQLWQLKRNLRTRLIPSIKKLLTTDDQKYIESISSIINAIIDYLSKPQLVDLVALNTKIVSLPESKERDFSEDVKVAFLRRSNIRHITAFSVSALTALSIYYADLNLGASQPEAFALGVGSLIAIVTLYVTYLGLTKRKETRT